MALRNTAMSAPSATKKYLSDKLQISYQKNRSGYRLSNLADNNYKNHS